MTAAVLAANTSAEEPFYALRGAEKTTLDSLSANSPWTQCDVPPRCYSGGCNAVL